MSIRFVLDVFTHSYSPIPFRPIPYLFRSFSDFKTKSFETSIFMKEKGKRDAKRWKEKKTLTNLNLQIQFHFLLLSFQSFSCFFLCTWHDWSGKKNVFRICDKNQINKSNPTKNCVKSEKRSRVPERLNKLELVELPRVKQTLNNAVRVYQFIVSGPWSKTKTLLYLRNSLNYLKLQPISNTFHGLSQK